MSEDIKILLDGQEIEPTGVYDFSYRRVPTSKVKYFRGLPSQITVNPDDKNRIQLWYGDKLGHNEQTVLQSDLDTHKYFGAFKNIGVDFISKKLSNETFTLDPDCYGIAYLQLADAVVLDLKEPKNVGTRIQIFAENLYRDVSLSFADSVTIKWISSVPLIPTDAGKTFCLTLTWNGTFWLGGQDSNTSSSNSASKREVSACLNAAVMSLGYCLPAGSSSAGEYADKYALFSGIANYSDDDLINIAQVATNIGNINDVAKAKDAINNVEDHLSEIATLSSNINSVNSVATNLTKIEELLKRYEALNTTGA